MDSRSNPRPLAPESSIELVRRARAGDRAALDQLFLRHAAPLRRWATGRLPRWARGMVDTDDLVQETLIGAVTRIDAFEVRQDGALQAYLRQALRNRVVDELRKASRRPRPDSIPEGQPDVGPTPLEATIGHETAERYERALGRLSAPEREAVIARVEMGWDYEAIARALGKPSRDAARMAVSRALLHLAREMGHG
jgi:RNA polymerase sigma-70 factor (ECF subfamily)